jgi:hypothetical protein
MVGRILWPTAQRCASWTPATCRTTKVVAAITDVLAEMGKRFRESIQATDEADLVTQDRIALVACWIRVPRRRQGRCPPPSRRQRK